MEDDTYFPKRTVSDYYVKHLRDYFRRMKKFLELLPSCSELEVANANALESSSRDKISPCPLSDKLGRWRDVCGCSNFFTENKCRFKTCTTCNVEFVELVAHLMEMKDVCQYHKACLYYVQYIHSIRDVHEYVMVSSDQTKLVGKFNILCKSNKTANCSLIYRNARSVVDQDK